MKPKEIREKTLEELHKLNSEFREELFRLNLKRSIGQLNQVSNIGKVRRDIARVETIINEKLKPGA